MVLSNCAVDDLNIYRSYKKPFNLILARAKNEKWHARLEFELLGVYPPGRRSNFIRVVPAVARDFTGQALATAPCEPAAGTFPR